MTIRHWRNFIFCVLLLGIIATAAAACAHAEQEPAKWGFLGESALQGRVVELNLEHRFAVINLGSAEGVEKDMVFNVFQKDEEVAKIRAQRVRRHISACDIQLVYTNRGIAVGDLVIFKPVPPLVKLFKPLETTRKIGVDPIVVDIDAPKHKILSLVLKVFQEFGLIVTGSNSQEFTLQAYKNHELPLDIGLLTDYGPFVRNKVFYTAEIAATMQYNRLIIRLRGIYDSEGQVYNRQIKKSSTEYKETQEMAFTIKDLAEEM
ncbi:hypothetical protein ACFL1I_01190 [Candidatus Omnitrophota bacterium]